MTIDTTEFDHWTRRVSELAGAGMSRATRPVFERIRRSVTSSAKQRAGRKLRVRSGDLVDSIRAKVSGDGVELQAGGAMAPHARIHERGGSVSPKGRYLAIPFGDALTAAGRLHPRFRGGLRGISDLFPFESRGRPFLGWREGGQLKAGFALTPGPIRIRGVHYMRDALEGARPRVANDVRSALAEAFRGRR